MTELAGDEMTELVDADFPRVDLVQRGASGIPRWLITKQAEDSRGIVPAEFVRDLIGKAEPGDLRQGAGADAQRDHRDRLPG